ncbi:MAG: methyltransferase domain-containing protein [Anaerolineae bacterium]|nr:methyltransferase domain-containing protein [Anaerolineae bacterium]
MTAHTRQDITRWLDVLGCPCCHSLLRQEAEGLVCTDGDHWYPIVDGIPSLVQPEDRARFAQFSLRYREARLREGWQPLTVDQALSLPFGSPPGYPLLYWEVRHQSYRALMRLLAREGPPPQAGPAADLGAGTGWLAYRLAQAGYRVLAVEASLDQDFGLGATEGYRAGMPEWLLPVQGDLEHPPLAYGKTSLIILNASLHYAADLGSTLRQMAAALHPQGRLVILDTPVARRPHPGTGKGDRHLGREELQQALLDAGLSPYWVRIPRTRRWWIRQLKAWAKGEALFTFPMIWACK